MKIKNHLTAVIKKENILGLLNYTKKEYRPYDPGGYLYNLMLKYPLENKFNDDFIELVYTTLIAWNMNQRGARLSDFEIFRSSLKEPQSQKIIQELKDLNMENLGHKDISKVKDAIGFLFNNLKLVAENKPRLVTYSKTLHFYLPNLLMPIDRSYTLWFFYNNFNFDKTNIGKQVQIYCDIFEEFRQFAEKYYGNEIFKKFDDRWNKNIPKMIDNIIIAFVSRERTETDV